MARMKFRAGLTAGGIAVLLLLGGAIWMGGNGWGEKAVGANFRMVNESVSKSANLVINLPPGEIPEIAVKNVRLNPEIKGNWRIGKETLVFDPERDLEVGKWFEVILMTDEGEMRAEFEATENPEVVAILPGGETEVDLKSNVTVIFNRSMIPLSSVNEMKAQNGIHLTPEVKGNWKWISTRTLQFEPETELIGSQKFEVRVDKFLENWEGVTLGKDFVQEFETKKLRLEDEAGGEVTVGFNKALELQFNQEVNLSLTKPQVKLWKKQEGEKWEVPFVLEFGERWEWDEEAEEEVLKVDKTRLAIRPSEDENGRNGKWDLESEWEVEILEVWPKAGNLVWTEKIMKEVKVPGMIKNTRMISEKSNILSESSFDPEGKLEVEFWGEVDLEQSVISGEKLTEVEQGMKCKNETEWDSEGCEKVEDKTKMRLIFENEGWEAGEKVEVNLEKLVMADGAASPKTINIELTAFPKLEVKASNPGFREGGSSTSEMILCTTTPLPETSSWGKEGSVSKKRWIEILGMTPDEFRLERVETFRVENLGEKDSGKFCEGMSEFVTKVSWNLAPRMSFYLNAKLEDQLGQKKNWQTWFETGEVSKTEKELLSLQERIVTTDSKNKVLTWAAVNMPEVNVVMCKMSATQMLNMEMGWLGENESPFGVNCLERKEETIQLPGKWWVDEMVEIDLDDFWAGQKGHWLVSVSGPGLTNEWNSKKRWVHTLVSVTDLAVVTKMVEQEVPEITAGVKDLVWVTSVKNKTGVKEARVETFGWSKNGGLSKKASGFSDEDGIARIETKQGVRGTIVTWGDDSAVVSDNWAHQLRWSGSVWASKKMWVESDREIFRPGETAHLRGTLRSGWDKNWEVESGTKLEISVTDEMGEEVWKEEVETDEWGVWEAEMKISEEARLGNLWVNVRDPKGEQIETNFLTLMVEEFEPAAFEVKMEIPEEAMDKTEVEVKVQAEKFVGMGVEGAKVEIGLTSQDWRFDKVKEAGWIWEEENQGWVWPVTHWINWKGEGETNAKGETIIKLPIDLEEWINEDQVNSQKVKVSVRVTDENGRSVSEEKEMVVLKGEIFLGLKSEDWAPKMGSEIKVEGKTVNKNGEERAASKLNLKVEKVTWKEDETGMWKEERKLISKEELDTNRTGNWERVWKMEEAGQHEITVQTEDEEGREIKTVMKIWVLGDGAVGGILPRGGEEERLEVKMAETEMKVGEIAKMVVQLPAGKSQVLWTLERGQVEEWMTMEREGNLEMEWEVKENQAPRVMATIVALSEDENGKMKVTWGEAELRIESEVNKLKVGILPEKTEAEPGEEVKVDVTVRDQEGNPVQAEMKVSVTDQAVEILTENDDETGMWEWWWNNLQSNVSTASNWKSVLIKNEEVLVRDGMAAGLGGGGGGMDEVRNDFKSTAWWEGKLVTNPQGRGTVTFKLPDNLTTWKIQVSGADKETRVGEAETKIMARKQVMINPLLPRFFREGDEMEVAAEIMNQSENDQELTVKLVAPELFKGEKSQMVSVAAGKSERVGWQFLVPEMEGEKTSVIMSAFNNEMGDTVEKTLPISQEKNWEVTATAGILEEGERMMTEAILIPNEAMKGEVEMGVWGGLGGWMEKLKGEVEEWEGEGMEILAAKIRAKVALGENVEGEVQEVEKRQNEDGGWSWIAEGRSDLGVTLEGCETLLKVREGGGKVTVGVIGRGAEMAGKKIMGEDDLKDDPEMIIRLLGIRQEAGLGDDLGLWQKVNSWINGWMKNGSWEELSNSALVRLAELVKGGGWENVVWGEMMSRVKIDARGSVLEGDNRNLGWGGGSGAAENTAALLELLMENGKQEEMWDDFLRWVWKGWRENGREKEVAQLLETAALWEAKNEVEEVKVQLEGFEEEWEGVVTKTGSSVQITKDVSEVKRGEISKVSLKKVKDEMGRVLWDLVLKLLPEVPEIESADEGMTVSQEWFRLEDGKMKVPVTTAKVGEILKVKIGVINPVERRKVKIWAPVPAGVELINTNLETESTSLLEGEGDATMFREWNWNVWNQVELKDEGINLSAEILPAGEWEWEGWVRALVPGRWLWFPTMAVEETWPENWGRDEGRMLEVSR